MRPGCSSRSPGSRAPGRREARDRPPVRTVTVNLVGVAPGVPRQLVLELDEGATVRALVEEVSRRGGERLRRSLWDEGGRVARGVVIALGGEVLDPARLDAPLPGAGEDAEVFLIHPIAGGGSPRDQSP